MKTALLSLFLAAVCCAQAQAPEQGSRQEILANQHVHVFSRVLAGHETLPLHRHDRDVLVVPLTDAHLTNHVEGKPAVDVVHHSGEPVMVRGGFSHSETNDGDAPVRLTGVEFTAPQGEAKPLDTPTSRFCNQGSKTACVTERYLFCTDKVCVSSVEFGPNVVTEMHRHATPHMLIALTDFDMKDEQAGKAAEQRSQKSGEAVYLPAGINHALVNGPRTARFITVVWK